MTKGKAMTNQNPEPAAAPEPAPEPAAAPEPATPEPAPEPANAYESIIEQQQAQIAALMEQTKTLNAQIVNLVSSGAQLNQMQQAPQQAPQQQAPQQQAPQQQMQMFNPDSLADDKDWSLEGLAEQIGKK